MKDHVDECTCSLCMDAEGWGDVTDESLFDEDLQELPCGHIVDTFEYEGFCPLCGDVLVEPCPQCGKEEYTSDCQYCNENRYLRPESAGSTYYTNGGLKDGRS